MILIALGSLKKGNYMMDGHNKEGNYMLGGKTMQLLGSYESSNLQAVEEDVYTAPCTTETILEGAPLDLSKESIKAWGMCNRVIKILTFRAGFSLLSDIIARFLHSVIMKFSKFCPLLLIIVCDAKVTTVF